MNKLLALIFSILIVSIAVWYSEYSKKKIQSNTEDELIAKTEEYLFKPNKVQCLIGLYFSIGLMIAGFTVSKDPSDYTFGKAMIIFGFVLLLIILVFLKRTYISFKDNIFTYRDGFRLVLKINLDDIKEVKIFQRNSVKWFLVIVDNYNKEYLVDIKTFQNPHLIYAILKEKIQNPQSESFLNNQLM